MIENCADLEEFWHRQLERVECDSFARAYLSNLLARPVDLSDCSLSIVFLEAKQRQDFEQFQNLGDYLFFAKSCYPEALSGASEEYYQSLARLSYYSCFRLINRKMFVYEYLADEFVKLTEQIRAVKSDIDDHKFLISHP